MRKIALISGAAFGALCACSSPVVGRILFLWIDSWLARLEGNDPAPAIASSMLAIAALFIGGFALIVVCLTTMIEDSSKGRTP